MPTPWQHLFHPAHAEHYRASVGAAADHLVAHLVDGPGAGSGRPLAGTTPRAAAERVAAVDLDRPLTGADDPLQASLEELSRLWLDDAVWFHEPRAAAHLNCPVLVPALAAEVLVSAVNSSLDTFDQSVGATFIERHLVDWTAARIGFDERADGVFTTGGTQSNLQALLLARGQQVAPTPRLRVLAGADGHFSVQKAARMLGLGDDAVLTVPLDRDRRMDPAALAAVLAGVVADGAVPMAVVATAGTTDFGAIDPLGEVAALARAYGAWLHVDAAYGGGLLVSPRRRSWLDGIELADSVAVDYHKTWFQPVSCSALVVRDGATLGHVTWHADYLNPKDSAHPNQVDKSLQTTRRFEALKLWTSLRVLGPDAIGEHLDAVVDLTAEVAAGLAGLPDVELAADPRLSTIVFRHVPAPGLDEDTLARHNAAVRAELFDTGRALVAATRVDGRAFLKLTLLNPLATRDDVLGIVDDVRATGARLHARRTSSDRLAVAR